MINIPVYGDIYTEEGTTYCIRVHLCDRLRSNTVEQRGCVASTLTWTLYQICLVNRHAQSTTLRVRSQR